MSILQLEGLQTALQTTKKAIITTHYKPDGDAIGSSLGLYHYLIQLGIDTTIVLPSGLPAFLEWLPNVHEASINFEHNQASAAKLIVESDIIFCLDYNKMSRTEGLASILSNAAQPKVLIDHHMDPEVTAFKYLFSDDSKSSTCEMIYDFIHYMDDLSMLNVEIMTSIYTGMMTDTGSFRFPSTTAHVHEIIAHFIRLGLKHSAIHEAINDAWSESRMRFLGYLLLQKMQIFQEHGYGYIYISLDDLRDYQATAGDTEGIVNYILSIHNIKVAILITEKIEGVKLSFRSKGNIDVNAFANQNFGGGGHFNAAGATTQLNWNEVKQIIETKIPALVQSSLNEL